MEEVTDLKGLVLAQSAATLNGAVRFQSLDPRLRQSGLLDINDCLNNWTSLGKLHRLIDDLDLDMRIVGDETAERLQWFQELLDSRFEVDAPFLREHSLYPFQHAGMNLCLIQERTLIQWCAGGGKSLLGSLVAKRLLDDDEIDLVLIICKLPKKLDWAEYVTWAAGLETLAPEGSRDRRHKLYRQVTGQERPPVLILNYERLSYPRSIRRGPNRGEPDWGSTDLWEILKLIEGRRILVIMDEAHKMGNSDTLVSRGIRGMLNQAPGTPGAPTSARAIALTATPLVTSPYNIRNIFYALVPGLPLVSDADPDKFDEEYVEEMGEMVKWGEVQRWVRRWNDQNLPRLGRRIEKHTVVALKSDPEIAAQFPEMIEREMTIELSAPERRLYDSLVAQAREAFDGNDAMANLSNFNILRMMVNTPDALRWSQSEAAADAVASGLVVPTAQSAKYQTIASLVETFVDAGEKVVLFTFWANAVLRPYQQALTERFPGVPIFTYTGVSMSQEIKAASLRDFNATPGSAIMLMSDAGAEGLNIYCPYLIHIEVPTTYAAYMQRRERIHRADSKDHGIDRVWIYRFLTRDTIEWRVADRAWRRRHQAELVQGMAESSAVEEKMTMEEIRELMFG